MEKKKFNITYILVLFLIILLIVGAYKSLNEHYKKEYLVVNNKILEAAKECYLNTDCEGEITIKDLYEKKYLDPVIDPRTKENISEDLCLKYINDTAEFCS
jgi:hypothetical protein